MPPRAWQERIRDMLLAIAAIQRALQDTNLTEFRNQEASTHAVLHHLIILGEAANQLPNDITDRTPNIPWLGMRDLRNLLIHEYFRVNLVVIWEIVTLELPQLPPLLHELLTGDVPDDGEPPLLRNAHE